MVLSSFTDRRWRLTNLYHIKDPSGQKVRFAPNEAQLALLEGAHFKNVILKARQLGFTTLIQIVMLDECLFRPNTSAGVIAHNRDDAEAFFNDKIKFAYEAIDKDYVDFGLIPTASQDNARQLVFSNGSSIRVGTSLRSGTFQMLHISEYGKLCAKYPEKAKEVKTGALNTVHSGGYIWIESTAEGQEGDFKEKCDEARAKAQSGTPLTPMDYKFHFFPWWKHPAYSLSEDVRIPAEQERYFGKLAEAGINLTTDQKAWYVKKATEQGEDIKREFPSSPEEAFEASIEGAYYSAQMSRARLDGRIGFVPYEPSLPVNTAWDLGMDDSTTIWLHQRHLNENRLIGYYRNNGEALTHYVGYLKALNYDIWGRHFLPHDVMVRSLNDKKTRKEVLEENGLRDIVVVPRTENLGDEIDIVRQFLASCWFDEAKCSEGIASLDNYRKDWDDKMSVFKSYPRHDKHSHGADSFRALAVNFEPEFTGVPTPVVYPQTAGGWMA